MHRSTSAVHPGALMVTLCSVLTACGSDGTGETTTDAGTSTAASTTGAPTTTVTPTTDQDPTTTDVSGTDSASGTTIASDTTSTSGTPTTTTTADDTSSSSTAAVDDTSTGDTGTTGTSTTGETDTGLLTCQEELCDPDHLGLDDDCDGQVDEGCTCMPGQAHACFMGDPMYLELPACVPGTELCTPEGNWGPCEGGFHAIEPDDCYEDTDGPHTIYTVPFRPIDLATGLGDYGLDAIPGSETWMVSCPDGVDPCPEVMLPSTYVALQSGEYTVHYTKDKMGGGSDAADYLLIVGVQGIRVELTWEHPQAGFGGVDLDLWLHRPATATPWAAAENCGYTNCTVGSIDSPEVPLWFAEPPAAPPDPVNWWLYPELVDNNCYFVPRGVGQQWQSLAQGCRNPRLDLDNVSCDPTVMDLEDFAFCAPENINIDFPPFGEWLRIGVHDYSHHAEPYDVHPRLKVFCGETLAADLGPAGFHDPEAPVTFTPADGAAGPDDNRMWLVADVRYEEGQTGTYCTVQPLYADPVARTPYLTTRGVTKAAFGPPYPP